MTKNKTQTQATQERRRSNAAGTMLDKRTKRNRTRDAQKRTAIRESRD